MTHYSVKLKNEIKMLKEELELARRDISNLREINMKKGCENEKLIAELRESRSEVDEKSREVLKTDKE